MWRFQESSYAIQEEVSRFYSQVAMKHKDVQCMQSYVEYGYIRMNACGTKWPLYYNLRFVSRQKLAHVIHPCASQALFGTFLLRAHVPFFQISYYCLDVILVSASSSCFALAVLMREVPCVRYTPRAWDLRSLKFILDGPLYFEANWP